MDKDYIELLQDENTGEFYEPYATIVCKTEEDFKNMQEALEREIKQPTVNNWISVEDRLPENDTSCCVSLKIRQVCFDYETSKQKGKEYIKNCMTDGYYNENKQWELLLNEQITKNYYCEYGVFMFEDEIVNKEFPPSENNIIIDIVSKNKKTIERTEIEVLAWFPLMVKPYKS